MRRTKRDLPIIFGVGSKADKCCIIGKHRLLKNGFSFSVCYLHHDVDYGDEIEDANIKGEIIDLHFCTIEAARAFRDSASKLVEAFEKEEAEHE